jgi:hypothetical protein
MTSNVAFYTFRVWCSLVFSAVRFGPLVFSSAYSLSLEPIYVALRSLLIKVYPAASHSGKNLCTLTLLFWYDFGKNKIGCVIVNLFGGWELLR